MYREYEKEPTLMLVHRDKMPSGITDPASNKAIEVYMCTNIQNMTPDINPDDELDAFMRVRAVARAARQPLRLAPVPRASPPAGCSSWHTACHLTTECRRLDSPSRDYAVPPSLQTRPLPARGVSTQDASSNRPLMPAMDPMKPQMTPTADETFMFMGAHPVQSLTRRAR
eukprot:3512993-Prymnesium_polylepis.1